MKLFLILFLSAISITSFAQPCLVNNLILNTGYNPATTSVITSTGTDPHWRLTGISTASNTGTGSPFVTGSNAQFHPGAACCQSSPSTLPPLVALPANATWIDYSNSMIGTSFSTTNTFWVDYSRTFTLCQDDNVTFSIDAAADNWYESLRLDGTISLRPNQTAGVINANYYLTGIPVVTGPIFLNAGVHTISVRVFNQPLAMANNPTNFLLVGSVTSANNSLVSETANCLRYSCQSNCSDSCYWKVEGNNILNGNNIFGTLSNHDVRVYTNNTSRGIITAAGDWGMGTISPGTRLNVQNSIDKDRHIDVSGNAPTIRLYNGTTYMGGGSPTGRLGLAADAGDYVNTSIPGDLILQNTSGGDVANGILFGTNWDGSNGLERMRISNSGQVGINTIFSTPIDPTSYLHVNCINGLPDDGANGSDVRFENLEPGWGTVLVMDANGFVYNSYKEMDFGMKNSCGTVNMVPKVNSKSGNLEGSQIFDNGTSVGINKTTGFGYTSLSGGLLGSAIPLSNGTIRHDVNGVSRSIAHLVTSDAKLKSNVKSIPNALKIVQLLSGKTFTWNEIAQKSKGVGNGLHIGFLAQDLQKIIPEVVIKDEDGTLGVNYNEIIPILSEAIKEQQIQIELQTKQSDELIRALSEMKNKLNDLISCCKSSGIKIEAIATDNILYQNVPNPFTQSTKIEFFIGSMIHNASINVYDLNGKELARNPITKQGNGTVTINSYILNPGMYIYSLIVDGVEVASKKMVLTSN